MYSDVELEILKEGGKKALKKFHAAKRKLTCKCAPHSIESKKFKRKRSKKVEYEDT